MSVWTSSFTVVTWSIIHSACPNNIRKVSCATCAFCGEYFIICIADSYFACKFSHSFYSRIKCIALTVKCVCFAAVDISVKSFTACYIRSVCRLNIAVNNIFFIKFTFKFGHFIFNFYNFGILCCVSPRICRKNMQNRKRNWSCHHQCSKENSQNLFWKSFFHFHSSLKFAGTFCSPNIAVNLTKNARYRQAKTPLQAQKGIVTPFTLIFGIIITFI